MQARNAHFNLNRLGVVVQNYADNFYGTDYFTDPSQVHGEGPGLKSDRLFASWNLISPRVVALSSGDAADITAPPVGEIAIPTNWTWLVNNSVAKARQEQERVRTAFKDAFARGLICARFERGETSSRYLLYDSTGIAS